MTDWQQIAEHISAASGSSFGPATANNLGGGCINEAVRLSDATTSWFVKLNRATRLDMFEAELAGLDAMHRSASIRVPKPLCTGTTDNQAYIVMEFIALGRPRAGSSAQAGRQLAALHRSTAPAFGWQRANTIGSTPQPNDWNASWVEFWRDHRLGYQLQLAARNGYGGQLQTLGERLLESFPALIDHDPAPSLLHGDLWGGNLSFDAAGEPVIYDPATYYGDREAELAMTELFGGFGGDFYAAYQEAWPLDRGYGARKTLYNLYHILNHLNLFGPGYLGQAQGMLQRLLAETG